MKKIFAAWEKLSGMFYPTFYLYYKIYKNVIAKEIALANINAKDNVLNIGCGAIPFTAIHIAKITGAKVTAMDIDEEAVEKCKKYLKKYKLDKNITVIQGNGEEKISDEFTVVIVALQVFNKEKTYNNLKNSLPTIFRAIFRIPTSKYSSTYGDFPPDFHFISSVEQNMKTFKKSVLL